MPEALQDLILRFLLPVVQKPHGDLEIIPHTFLSDDTEVRLLLHPVVHDPVDLLIRGMYCQGTDLTVTVILSFPEFFFHSAFFCIPADRLCRLRAGTADPEENVELLLFPRLQGKLMLEHQMCIRDSTSS